MTSFERLVGLKIQVLDDETCSDACPQINGGMCTLFSNAYLDSSERHLDNYVRCTACITVELNLHNLLLNRFGLKDEGPKTPLSRAVDEVVLEHNRLLVEHNRQLLEDNKRLRNPRERNVLRRVIEQIHEEEVAGYFPRDLLIEADDLLKE